MTSFEADYAGLYDILYATKDYQAEVDYVTGLIRRFAPKAARLLDLGCGTAAHDVLMLDQGFSVHGIDLSEAMLSRARQRCGDRMDFTCSSIADFNLGQQFDVVTALFHVINYLTTNDALAGCFNAVARHLIPGGLFVFDFWYGPAVLMDPPRNKILRITQDNLALCRVTEPVLRENDNIVDVQFDAVVTDTNTGTPRHIHETHNMRYLFLPEIDALLAAAGLRRVMTSRWMHDEPLSRDSWYGVVVAVRG